MFAAEELPFPPLPAPLAARLGRLSDATFSTRPMPDGATPYNLEIFADEVLLAEVPEDYAVIGFDGHGMNSWAAHLFVVSGPLALFIQTPWGGAYADVAQNRSEVVNAFSFSAWLQDAIGRVDAADKIPDGWRLLVIASPFARAGWAWVPADAATRPPIELNPARQMKARFTEMFADLVDGTLKLA